MKVCHACGTKHQVHLLPGKNGDLEAKDQWGNVFETPQDWVE